MAEFIQVSTTASSRDEAERIAAALLEGRLAACVQILGPMQSRYWWKGSLESAEEWLCLIKTAEASYADVEKMIRATHSYEVPEIVAVPIVKGSAAYLDWVREETSKKQFS